MLTEWARFFANLLGGFFFLGWIGYFSGETPGSGFVFGVMGTILLVWARWSKHKARQLADAEELRKMRLEHLIHCNQCAHQKGSWRPY